MATQDSAAPQSVAASLDSESSQGTSSITVGTDPSWSQGRWVKILDRIEHRQPDVGLRFWGPTLWLEVTMTGPDSDLWPANTEHAVSWDWQSSAACEEVAGLAAQGADDDHILAVIGRYTIENLILNAVHEIGEWFRFDGRRVFPAHISHAGSPGERDIQGNGTVALQLTFEQTREPHGAHPARPAPGERGGERLVRRLAYEAAASRFTYLPGTTISYEAAGPVIRRWSCGEQPTAWRSDWSSSTMEAVGGAAEEVVALVGRDVHSALVLDEADRICRAFHLDGCRPWRLAIAESALGADPPDSDWPNAHFLSISIDYTKPVAARDSVPELACALDAPPMDLCDQPTA